MRVAGVAGEPWGQRRRGARAPWPYGRRPRRPHFDEKHVDARKIFSNIGPIEKIFVPTASSNDYNDTNRAEILYQTSKHAKIAVKVLNNLTLCDNELKLTLANSDVNINVSNNRRKKNDGNDVTRDDIDMLLQIP